jgi:hypothetical protein
VEEAAPSGCRAAGWKKQRRRAAAPWWRRRQRFGVGEMTAPATAEQARSGWRWGSGGGGQQPRGGQRIDPRGTGGR